MHLTIPTKEDLLKAKQRVEPYIFKTPVIQNDFFNELVGGKVYFKCENLQRIGAFKVRGAVNAVLQLSAEEKKKGIATHSSGNHAQAIAFAAKLFGLKAYIVMPENSSPVKLERVRELGAEVILCKATLQSRETMLKETVDRTGAVFIPPFDHINIVCGQGSAAIEFLEEVPKMDILMAPVGGGGLLSGTALAAKYFSPSTLVWGAEPEMADDASRALRSGKFEENDPSKTTMADGLRTTLGKITFPIIKENVSDILTVSEEEIKNAMALIWNRLHVIIEPSSAVPVAALIKYKERFMGKTTGIIFSGGNVNAA
jgi:threonine dehydratase